MVFPVRPPASGIASQCRKPLRSISSGSWIPARSLIFSIDSSWRAGLLLSQPSLEFGRYEKIVTLANQAANSASSLSESDNFSTNLYWLAALLSALSLVQKSLGDSFPVRMAPLGSSRIQGQPVTLLFRLSRPFRIIS